MLSHICHKWIYLLWLILTFGKGTSSSWFHIPSVFSVWDADLFESEVNLVIISVLYSPKRIIISGNKITGAMWDDDVKWMARRKYHTSRYKEADSSPRWKPFPRYKYLIIPVYMVANGSSLLQELPATPPRPRRHSVFLAFATLRIPGVPRIRGYIPMKALLILLYWRWCLLF